MGRMLGDIVNSFCFLGNMLSVEGGVDVAVTFVLEAELVWVRAMGWAGRAGDKHGKVGGDDDHWMWCVSLNERQPSTDTRRCLVVETIVDVMRRCSLRCQGHTESTKL